MGYLRMIKLPSQKDLTPKAFEIMGVQFAKKVAINIINLYIMKRQTKFSYDYCSEGLGKFFY